MQSGLLMKRFLVIACIFWLSLLSYKSFAADSIVSAANSGSGTPYVCPSSFGDSCHVETYTRATDTVGGTAQYWKAFICNDGQIAGDVIFETNTVYGVDYQEPMRMECWVEPPPQCESPNYIDVVSGECLEPEPICITTLETMSEECMLIGEDDPNDDVPNGCALNEETGIEFCLSEQEGCYQVDGDTVCPTPDMVCGTKNGTFACVAPEQEGCGYFNGERICFDPGGEKVENDSPDHPDNGGNLDGDDTNDVTDSRDPTEGGDPSNQPGAIPETQPGDEATEATARKNLNENKKTAENTKKSADSLAKIQETLEKEKLDNEDSLKAKVEQAGNDAITGTGVDDHISGIGDSEIGTDQAGETGNILKNALPQTGGCTEIRANLWRDKQFHITCQDTQRLREILSWVFYVTTVWYLFNLVTNPPHKGLK